MRKTRWIHIDNYDVVEAEEIIEDLGDILKALDINMKISETSLKKRFEITYDNEALKKKLSRSAGMHRKITNSYITIGEAKERMRNGETAEKIAKELGISRATLFRRLKELGELDDFAI